MRIFRETFQPLMHDLKRFYLRLKLDKEFRHNLRMVFDLKYRHYEEAWKRLQEISSTMEGEDINPEKLKGWIPVTLNLSQKRQTVGWLDLGQTSFTDPFFSYTICRAMQDPNTPQPIFTKLDVLTALQDISPGLKPKGFIFHISKCGSTLLANMLSSLPHNLVISMADPIHSALMAPILIASANSLSDSFRIELLQSVISALGQPRQGVEENYFIRFEPYHIPLLPLIKKAFPEVPWVFLYRHPVEVMVSNLLTSPFFVNFQREQSYLVKQVLNLSALDLLKMSPNDLYLAKQLLDFSASDLGQMRSEEFTARAIGSFCRIGVQQVNAKALVINYNQLSESCLCKVLSHFQIKVSDAEVATMAQALRFYSKNVIPGEKIHYKDDKADKQKMAWKKIHDSVEQWVMDSYKNLEMLKISD